MAIEAMSENKKRRVDIYRRFLCTFVPMDSENEKFLEAVLRTVYLYRNESGICAASELRKQLYENGSFYGIANEDTRIATLLHSETYQKYICEVEIAEEPNDIVGYRLTEDGENVAKEIVQDRYRNPQTLFSWAAFIGGFDNCIRNLAEMAIPEKWGDTDDDFGILKSYMVATFARLLHEKKEEHNDLAIIENEKWAAINTGLVTRLYDPIYGLFARNKREDRQKWVFHSWCTPGYKRAGQNLSRFFTQLPTRAQYFNKPEELVYNSFAGVPTLPFEHILERLHRLPVEFLRQHAPGGMEVPNNQELLTDEFYDSYRNALLDEDNGMDCLRFKDALELSLRRAIKRVGCNYRLAMPAYDAKRRRLMLLIPMWLLQTSERPDIALMVERAKVSRNYVGHTILTPAMAYKKVRMLMSPEADWLYSDVMTSGEHRSVTDDDELQMAKELSENEAADLAAEKEEATKEQYSAKDAFMYQHEKDEIFRPELQGPKVIETVSIDSLPSKQHIWGGSDTPELKPYEERGYWIEQDGYIDIYGTYHEAYGDKYVLVGKYKFQAREFTDTDLIDGDDVVFDIETEPNRVNPERVFRYAKNIRLSDD